MSFDPNDPLDSQEAADAYVSWAAEQFMRTSHVGRRTFRSALRGAHWLLVVATAQLHLDEEVVDKREALLEQLASYALLARALERQSEHYPVGRLIVLRSSLDCWEPTGEWAGNLLDTAKSAVSALILIEAHPLIDVWKLPAPDVWSLLDRGCEALAEVNLSEDLSFADFAVRPDEAVIAKFTWQKVNNLSRHMGAPPFSAN